MLVVLTHQRRKNYHCCSEIKKPLNLSLKAWSSHSENYKIYNWAVNALIQQLSSFCSILLLFENSILEETDLFQMKSLPKFCHLIHWSTWKNLKFQRVNIWTKKLWIWSSITSIIWGNFFTNYTCKLYFWIYCKSCWKFL